MNGVRTRKQTAKGGKPKDEKTAADANGNANGYINTNGLVAKRAERAETSENIFLFYPNIIGGLQVLSSPAPVSDHSRLHTHHPCHCISLLHAPSSKNVLHPVQHLMPVGCPGRRCRSILSAVDSLRCRARHGHRSLHNRLLVGVSELGLAAMGAVVPRTDQFGLGEPLHAHVCNADHGWIGKKPQAGGSEQEPHSTSVLQQQGLSSAARIQSKLTTCVECSVRLLRLQ